MELNAYPEANLGYLSTVGSHLGDRPVMAEAVRVAIAEIERLRASRFRWVFCADRMPRQEDGDESHDVLWITSIGETISQHWDTRYPAGAEPYAWARIPPLPEKSQADRDVEIWQEHVLRGGGSDRASFLAGMKAARSQQP